MVITHDSDAVDAERRWGLVVIIAVLQAVPKKKKSHEQNLCQFCFVLTVSIFGTHF